MKRLHVHGLALALSILCTALVLADDISKEGNCPVQKEMCMIGVIKDITCTSDADCKGFMKCCSSCTGMGCAMPKGIVKPGTCPQGRFPCDRENAAKEGGCKEDGDCQDNKKCCSDCGRKCREPKGPAPRPAA
ncbi:whey acidic protein-like [Ambystoma mexicanum]|uniref:whey acidic protein-like n=1 Tax=Ambystoma mexicanum TaxID=8296 RepID=UPI0037E9B36A